MDVASTVTRFALSLLGCNVTGLYLGEISTPQAVRLFIRAPLPRALWVAKLDHYQIFGSGSVSNVFIIGVCGQQIHRTQCSYSCPSNGRSHFLPIPGSDAHLVVDQLAVSPSLLIHQLELSSSRPPLSNHLLTHPHSLQPSSPQDQLFQTDPILNLMSRHGLVDLEERMIL